METKFETLGDVVRRLRKDRKLTLQQLADQIDDYDAGNLSRFERGAQGINGEKLQDIARALGVAVSAIYGMLENQTELASFEAIEPAGLVEGEVVSTKKSPTDKVPLISWVTAGAWEEPIDNYHVGDAEDWFPCPPNCKQDTTFALMVTGDSMDDGSSQGYHDGEIIFVDGSKNEALHNSDVIVKNKDGKVTFKRLINSNGDIYLKPLNPDWPDKMIMLDEDSKIVGRVMFSGRAR